MIKKLMTGLLLTASTIAFSQVGIGTVNPHASADLELGSNNKALYLNRVANTAAVANPQPGMIIYDLQSKCVKAYQSNPAAWSDCLIGGDGGVLEGSITSLNCAAAVFLPASATQGQAYTGTLKIPYTGGNGGVYPANSVTINGLTFSLPLGVFATGNGELTYNITGTPVAAGTTLVSITAGGQSCSGANAIALMVNPATGNPTGVLPGTVTLAQNSRYFIASVNDNDYLPYTAPTGPASTAVINAGGGTDLLVDIQGIINNTTGVTVYIPATVTGSGGNVAAWSSTITIPANLTEDNTSRQMQLSWAAQTLTTANTSIVATIKGIAGNLNAKKLDINAGIGSNHLGLLLGAFQYPYNQAGVLTTYELRDIPGIPDRMFGQIDNAGIFQHNFLYLPVQAEDGKIWLNNNLGANYANVDSSIFNLTQQATSSTDINAMGSLFQWGRKADGHELVIRDLSISSVPTFKYGRVNTQIPTWSATIPNPVESLGDWTSATVPAGVNRLLASSPNNPCPQGFKVPTKPEMQAVVTAAGGANQLFVTTKKLRLTIGGHGGGNSPYVVNTTVPAYWLSDGFSGSPYWAANSFYSNTFYGAGTGNMDVTYGKSVRCIQQ